MRTKVSGPDSLELALIMKMKERKIEKWPFFEHLVLACTIDLMNNLSLVRYRRIGMLCGIFTPRAHMRRRG